MLDTLFLHIFNMSFTASMVILLVLVVRLLLKKAPKCFAYALWSVVLFRLVCPFSFESIISLLPFQTSITPENVLYTQTPTVNVGIPAVSNAINAVLPAPNVGDSVNPMQIIVHINAIVWLIGIASMLIYSVVSLVKLRHRLKNVLHEKENIYTSSTLTTPFVMGLFRPKIYLPAHLSDDEKRYILLHEQTHIKRLDHVVKIVSYFVLCLHWFNPLVWVAFFLSGRDMELSCDESVIKRLGSEVKKDYSSSLLTLATGRRIIGGTPLAFGEGDTKSRIKNVLNYKKPAFWVIVVSVIAVAAVGVGLLANPKSTAQGSTSEGIHRNRTQYVGDNAKVGGIITELSFPSNVAYNGFALHTAERPYGITVSFKTDTQTRNYYAGELHQAPFEKNAMIMFSLIENAEYITFVLEDGANPYSFQYTSDQANAILGENYFKQSESIDEFNLLLKTLDEKVGQQQSIPPADFIATISQSFQIKEGVARFIIPDMLPEDYDLSQLSVHVSLIMPIGGSNMSIHAYEDEDAQRDWQLGEEYIERLFEADVPDGTEVYAEFTLLENDESEPKYTATVTKTFPQLDNGDVGKGEASVGEGS